MDFDLSKADGFVSALVLVVAWLLREIVPAVKNRHSDRDMGEEINYLYRREIARETIEKFKNNRRKP